MTVLSKSPNKHNRLYVKAKPMGYGVDDAQTRKRQAEHARDAADEHLAALRAGGLKNCYESRTPAIIVITDGKERIWNEKTGRCSFRTVLYRARHAPIGVRSISLGRAARPLRPTVGSKTVA